MQCLCSGGKNKVSMRDHDPWFIPYGYEMDDWVVIWWYMLVLEPKGKLFISLFKPKGKLFISLFKVVRIALVKRWWTTRNGRRRTQWSSKLCGCMCTRLIWCCPLQPFYMRYVVVHFDQKIMLFFVCLPQQQNEFYSSTVWTEKSCGRQTQCSSTLCRC